MATPPTLRARLPRYFKAKKNPARRQKREKERRGQSAVVTRCWVDISAMKTHDRFLSFPGQLSRKSNLAQIGLKNHQEETKTLRLHFITLMHYQ